MIEAIRSLHLCHPKSLLDDHDTRKWLAEQGFDLSKPISWWDTETDCRHFTQGYKSR
jgi:hypothetical protein